VLRESFRERTIPQDEGRNVPISVRTPSKIKEQQYGKVSEAKRAAGDRNSKLLLVLTSAISGKQKA